MVHLSTDATAPKVARTTAETPGQVKTWDEAKSRYLRAGFCHRCASQAAWGHQLGFTHAAPPCTTCAGLPVPASAGARATAWSGTTNPDTAATPHPPRPAPADRSSCGDCTRTWTGLSACHCSGCHLTWSGITLFDRHRTARGDHGECLPPDEIAVGGRALELVDGVWRQPSMTDEQKLARFGDRVSST